MLNSVVKISNTTLLYLGRPFFRGHAAQMLIQYMQSGHEEYGTR